MNIDWFTFSAQIFNFLLLVWLLKKFLYGPVISAMDQREADMAERLHNLTQATEAAEQKQQDYQNKVDSLQKNHDALMTEAHQDVQQWLDEHLQRARSDVESARQEWQQSVAREKETLIREIQSEVCRQTVYATERLLTELADTQLQNHIADQFVRRLDDISDETSVTLRTAHQTQDALVNTSHELSETERQRVESAVRRLTESDRKIAFRIKPELVCGIELQVSGHKLAWSGKNAIDGLESQLIASINQLTPLSDEQAAPQRQPSDSRVSAP